MARILVVDDELGIRIAVAANLERAGFVVDQASSAADAKEKWTRGKYDLVITDFSMPLKGGGHTENGLDLVRFLRDEQKSNVPIILHTSTLLDEDERAEQKRLKVGLLPKPSLSEEILAAVKAALGVDGPSNGRASLTGGGGR